MAPVRLGYPLPPGVDFCAAKSTGVLRYVTDPSQCTSSEFPVFVTNHAPRANGTSAATNEDRTVTITLSGSDEDGDDLTFQITDPPNDPPDNGVLGPIITTGHTTATVDYTPNQNFNGGDSFTYTVYDGNGGTDTATVTITVNAANDPPSFTAGGDVTVNEDSGAYSATWATDISPGPANESGQTVSFNVIDDNHNLFASGGQPAISSDGTLTFTPAADAFGSATVEVDARDNGGTANGGVDTSTQTFTITVNAVNDEPSFTAGGDVTVNEDSGAYSAAWATAISAGPRESGQTVSFQVSNDNNALFSVPPAISSSGTLTFTPAADAFGSATVTVYLMDNGGTANGGDDTSPTQTFTITVNAVDD